jgi:hypothetical protein
VTAKATFNALKAFKGAQKAVVAEHEIKKEEIEEKEKVMTKLKPKPKAQA